MTLIEELAQGNSFKIKDLDIPESQRETARQTLKLMDQEEWVERNPSRSSIWRPGVNGSNLLFWRGTGGVVRVPERDW